MKDRFISFYFNELRHDKLWLQMGQTVEDSPWHHEDNVQVHTDMVITHYVSLIDDDWEHGDLLGAFACAFHDVGKPDAEELRESELRGVYRRYAGHEHISQRLWEDWATRNYQMLHDRFHFTPIDLYHVGWVIQHHLPYNFVKPAKRKALRRTILQIFGRDTVFLNCLIADCWGRIADDHQTKKESVYNWIREYQTIEVHASEFYTKLQSDKVCYMLIGASGSGKTTYTQMHGGTESNTHSMDTLRLEWYPLENAPDIKAAYRYAFTQSIEDIDFGHKVQSSFHELLNSGASTIFVDNTNLTTKRRNFYTNAARAKGYTIVGVLFPIAEDALTARTQTRADKLVPLDVVVNQYKQLQLPSLSEVDGVHYVGANLAIVHGSKQ